VAPLIETEPEIVISTSAVAFPAPKLIEGVVANVDPPKETTPVEENRKKKSRLGRSEKFPGVNEREGLKFSNLEMESSLFAARV
jgi:hypothetical protein